MSLLRIMSHNLWKCDKNAPAWEEKGENCSAPVRAEGFFRMYCDTTPDIIGCQEASELMMESLVSKWNNEKIPYEVVCGKDTPIVYRTDKLELLESAFDLYPEECPGFEGCFNNSRSKSWNIGVFRVKETNQIFVVLNTHLWWKSSNPESPIYQEGSDEARVYQLQLATRKSQEYQDKYQCPVVITGDMNAGYNALPLQYLMQEGYIHAHDVATEYADESRGYHTCTTKGYGPYRNEPFRSALDHILVKDVKDGIVLRFERFEPEYYLPLSDHAPVFIDMKF